MKKTLLLFSLLLVVLSGCKKDTVDVTELLKTVPSSAAGVMVFNVESMLEEAGCKIKDHKIIPGKEVQALLDKASSSDKQDFMMLMDDAAGIEPKGAVVFYDSNRAFLTVALYDVAKFCSFMEKATGSTFKDEGSGVKVCGRVAVKGAQAWICLTSGKTIDADAIASYAGLTVAQSFLTTDMGEKLLVDENDIRGWAVLDTFTRMLLDRSQRSMFTLGNGVLFENPESLQFKVDFDKGEMEVEAMVLNPKGKPAKYQLPADKVDVKTLESLGGTCDAMMAFTVNSKLIKKLDKLGSALGGALFGDLNELFKNIDGTVGITTSGDGIGSSVNGVITTKGEMSQTFKDVVSEYMGPITEDGQYVRFSRGDVKGSLNVAECADELKGCCLGMVWDAQSFSKLGYNNVVPQSFASYILKFKPESGGLEIDFEAKCADKNASSILTLLNWCK